MNSGMGSVAREMGHAGTTTRLLDAAERLFALHGYDGVGMRQLTDEAQVNLGAVTYHFGSKEALFIETFMRGFRPMNAERSRLLEEARAAAGSKPVAVEKIVECMIRPPFEFGLERPFFHQFLARNLFQPPPFLEAVIQQELAPNVDMFIQVLKQTLPGLAEDLIHLRTMLGMGGLFMFSVRSGEMPGMEKQEIREPLLREMVRFIAAGLQSKPAIAADRRPALPMPPAPHQTKKSKRAK